MKTDELKQWLAERKEAGKAIDVATCEITWTYGDLCSFAPPKATAGFRRTTCQRKARSLCTSASIVRAYRRRGRSGRRRKPQPSESGAHNSGRQEFSAPKHLRSLLHKAGVWNTPSEH